MLATLEECKVVIVQLTAERTDDQVQFMMPCSKKELIWHRRLAISLAYLDEQADNTETRNNAPAETPRENWKITLYNVCLDHLPMELEERLIIAEPKFKAFNLLLRIVNNFDEGHLNVTFDAYKAHIIGDRDDFRAEVHKWSLIWVIAASVCYTIKCKNIKRDFY